MKETQRIVKLFEDLYEGSPWIDVNLKNTLEQLTALQAAKKVLPGRNSIWEIVNHLIQWRFNVLQRVQGKKMISPDDNYFTTITDTSDTAWRKTLEQLKSSQAQWLGYLSALTEDDFSKIFAGNNMTYYEHIHGIMQHDAYHIGQIVMLTKLL